MNIIELKLSLISASPGIISMLKQEGIPFVSEEEVREEKLKKYAWAYLCRVIDTHEISAIKRYLLEGGVAVFDRLNTGLRSLPGAEYQMQDAGLKVFKLGKGYLIYIDIFLEKEFLDNKAIRKELSTSAGLVNELLALYPKYRLRNLLRDSLFLASRLKGLPLVKFWYYPLQYKTVFNLRFDLDEDTGDDLERSMEVSSPYKDCTTWFVSCASFKGNDYKIKDLVKNGFDVQSHGYYHHTYRDKKQNAISLKRSLEFLSKWINRIDGFAAPKGIWNPGLQELLEELNFTYGSEFSFDYDNFPHYPVISGRASKVLEIPVHPVCWGLFLDAGVSNHEAVTRYFGEVIRKKHEFSLPVLLYAHPNEGRRRDPALLRNIYSAVDLLPGVWKTTLSDFAGWWNKRNAWEFESISYSFLNQSISYRMKDGCDFRDGSILVSTSKERMSLQDIISNREISLEKLGYEESLAVKNEEGMFFGEKAHHLPIIRRIKENLVHYLDWEECTPAEEIVKDNLIGRIKYSLRKLGFDKVKLPV
ncbi:MAG TPA: polysaccharide deacetylase family protein [Candidatus Margulisiibacteriota bacterium]|nr:polysaccharide deacetylase family protein [Candidatus Margulisiibacteriota bacterium]